MIFSTFIYPYTARIYDQFSFQFLILKATKYGIWREVKMRWTDAMSSTHTVPHKQKKRETKMLVVCQKVLIIAFAAKKKILCS